jgi:hypothetical protein
MGREGKTGKWRFTVDRGGTFTDVIGIDPDGLFHTQKLLSLSQLYEDASIEGVRRILGLSSREPLPDNLIEFIRFGTTVATNALLERKGGRVALLITEGFADLLEIGYQMWRSMKGLTLRERLSGALMRTGLFMISRTSMLMQWLLSCCIHGEMLLMSCSVKRYCEGWGIRIFIFRTGQ